MATASYGTETAEYTRDGDDERVRLLYTVTGLEGNPAGRAIAAASASQIPRYNQPHPTRPDLRARRFRTSTVQGQPNTFAVEVTFLDPDAASGADGDAIGSTTVSMQTEVLSEVTTRDIGNRQMVTRYTRRLFGEFGARQDISQSHRVTVERPTFALRIERVESNLGFRNAVQFSGRVNSRPWQGLPAKHWLINISSEPIDAARNRIQYSATYNPDSWRATLIATLSSGVIPEPFPTEGNGVSVYDVYPSADFNRLGLPRYL